MEALPRLVKRRVGGGSKQRRSGPHEHKWSWPEEIKRLEEHISADNYVQHFASKDA